MSNKKIGIGVVGGGYMGKRHSVAFHAVKSVFDTELEPVCEIICATKKQNAERYRQAYGFQRATDDWRVLVHDPKVDAVVIATPQSFHSDIALAAFNAGKHVLCEKPLGISLEQSQQMLAAARRSEKIHMVGFNYIKTPATQYARQLIQDGTLGKINYFRAEHTEDFFADPMTPANWRTTGMENGALGDLSPHLFSLALNLMGPINRLNGEYKTAYPLRPESQGSTTMVKVDNDDLGHVLCHFDSGTTGYLHYSRVSTGRKMGYCYEVIGDKGSLRFDQEDQNALWYYRSDEPIEQRGFRKILTGPMHPDYEAFCEGPGHGTGYQDQIIVEAKDFLQAIAKGYSCYPNFEDGVEVNRIISAVKESNQNKSWTKLSPSS